MVCTYITKVNPIAQGFGDGIAQQQLELPDGSETDIMQPHIAFVETKNVLIADARHEGPTRQTDLTAAEEIDA